VSQQKSPQRIGGFDCFITLLLYYHVGFADPTSPASPQNPVFSPSQRHIIQVDAMQVTSCTFATLIALSGKWIIGHHFVFASVSFISVPPFWLFP
jgi:hypothetical protein